MKNIKILKLNQNSLIYYRNRVNRNQKATEREIQLKLTRNKMLALIYKTSKGKTWYTYGNLKFMVEDDVVEWIENGHSQHPKWEKDISKYLELSRVLGIETTQKVGSC